MTSLLDGSQGVNRNNTVCLISAANDLEAFHAYLYRFRGRDTTVRAYRKELERFLLWCVRARHTALACVLTRECEDYKDFLALPSPECVGGKAARSSSSWRLAFKVNVARYQPEMRGSARPSIGSRARPFC